MKTPLLPVAAVLIAGLLLPAPAAAQGAQGVGAKIAGDFERMRDNVLMLVDAMPADGLSSAPTEGVRSFAEQVEHVVVGNVNLITSGVDAPRADLGLDREVYLGDKEALAELVNVGFDRVAEILGGMSEADFQAEGSLFGNPMPAWMIAQAAYEHGVWTMGSLVPYLRLQGSAPEAYDLMPRTGG